MNRAEPAVSKGKDVPDVKSAKKDGGPKHPREHHSERQPENIDLQADVSWLKHVPSVNQSQRDIVEKMASTFTLRQTMVQKNLSAAEIIQEFPCFKKTPGLVSYHASLSYIFLPSNYIGHSSNCMHGGLELSKKLINTAINTLTLYLQIDQDFRLMFPDKNTAFIEAWTPSLKSKIVNLARSIHGNITANQLINTVEQGPSAESEMRGRCLQNLNEAHLGSFWSKS